MLYTESQLTQMAEQRLKELLYSIPFVQKVSMEYGNNNHSHDFVCSVFFQKNYRPVTFGVNVKSRGERRFADSFARQMEKNREWDSAFVAPYISKETAGFLKERHFNYCDLSGNCYIAIAPLFISIEGKPNRYNTYQYDRNYFSRNASAASAILRTLFDDYRRRWYIQTASDRSGKSIGAVYNVKTFLADHGWAESAGTGFRLCEIDELLKTWAREYHKKKDRVIKCYSMDSIPDLEWRIRQWRIKNNIDVAFGGFSAAARYASHVRYNKVSIYVETRDVSAFLYDLELEEVSSGENVTIILPHDETPLMYLREINGDLVTSPVQTIIDLLSGVGRGEEAANAILEKEFPDYD